MPKLLLLLIPFILLSCNRFKKETSLSCSVSNNEIVCPDGSSYPLPSNGVDGKDSVILTTMTLEKGSCTQVMSGLYVENILSGLIFDVYSNDQCKDSLGEHCDNVETSYGSSGQFGQGSAGPSSVCWIDNIQLSGVKLSNGDILLYILDFN
ncbi:MAG: hypothetical protein COB41_00175 [Proteobacteria bacterium]|nr:MAG: hypothetical protein COB41_00175 [Pseudomonadota bacterium]